MPESPKTDKKKVNFQPQEIPAKALDIAKRLEPYRFFIFLIFVALLYGFVLLQINNLSGAEPSSEAVSSQVQAAQIPHIDQSVIQQLQSLQNNSVSVQALFNQARSNPFQQ